MHSFGSESPSDLKKPSITTASFLKGLVIQLKYIVADLGKTGSGFVIGVFTVFLVVMIITMLKSVVDATPILFVKMGQQEAGAIDFKLTPTQGNHMLYQGNRNFYSIDPFSNTTQAYNAYGNSTN